MRDSESKRGPPMTNEVPVIAVDGPSGTGKGTLCSYLAKKLGWHLLDSGALYRVMAVAADRHGLSPDDESSLAELARGLDVRFVHGGDADALSVILEGENVDQAIRSEECGRAASVLAALPGVRAALLARQRAFRRPPGLIADGRDMGTVVFPDARLKVFLDASPEERARRRHKQLMEKGFSVNLAQLSADIAERDARDSQRAVSPLRPADDAIVIDTTDLDIEEVMDNVSTLVNDHIPAIAHKPGD